MKKFKFIMPAVALVFAVATAFATANVEVVQTDRGYLGGECTTEQDLDQTECLPIETPVPCTINNQGPVYATPQDCLDQVNPLFEVE